MKKKLITSSILFFIPVIGIYIILEALILNIPFNYKNISQYYHSNKDAIEVMVLGSSQMGKAINPIYIDKNTISLASTSQHHKLDFTLLKQINPNLEKLKYVVLELSTNHLELPHNSKYFWKNSIYLKYFNVNAFERKTYFKDKLIYLSKPDFYSKNLINYYFLKENNLKLNKFGFDENDYKGLFKKADYNVTVIETLHAPVRKRENLDLFATNTAFFFSMLDYLQEKNIKTIICTLPLYKTYIENLNPNIVNRRNQIIDSIKNKYPNIIIFENENNTNYFHATDYINHNHLNPDGAKKYTLLVNDLINSLE